MTVGAGFTRPSPYLTPAPLLKERGVMGFEY